MQEESAGVGFSCESSATVTRGTPPPEPSPKARFTVRSHVVCTGPDGKVKWIDDATITQTLEAFGVKSVEELEDKLQPQVLTVGG